MQARMTKFRSLIRENHNHAPVLGPDFKGKSPESSSPNVIGFEAKECLMQMLIGEGS